MLQPPSSHLFLLQGIMKQCTRCNTNKPFDSFYKKKGGKFGLTSLCKPCKYESDKECRARNPERVQRNGRSSNLAKYGITLIEYTELIEQQAYKCAICYKHTDDCLKSRLYVDHCHTTQAVRGLLCHNCNTLLGHAKDSVPTLESAIKYLQENSNNDQT